MRGLGLPAELAWRLAWARDPRQRWRQVGVVLAALLVAAAGVLGAGLLHAGDHADRVRADRLPRFAAQGTMPAYYAMADAITVDGLQVPVVWLQRGSGPLGPGMSPTPPGLTALPEPGSVVLSPGLVEAGVTAERLGMAAAGAEVGPGGMIGRAGLVAASEPLAYAVPRVDAPFTASTVAQPVAGFAPSTGDDDGFVFDTGLFAPSRMLAAMLGLWCLVLPGGLALSAGARSYSELRDLRVTFLLRQGLMVRGARVLCAVEAMALAAPGALVGAVLGGVLGPRLGDVPGTGTRLWPGDAAVPWWVPFAAALLVVGVAGVSAAAGRPSARRRRSGTAGLIRCVPLVIGWVVMFATTLLGSDVGSRTTPLMVGLLITTVGVPLAIPAMSAAIGRRLGAAEPVGPWLLGRRLQARAVQLAGPASAAAGLVFIAGCAVAALPEQTATAPAGSQVYVVDWVGPDASAPERARRAHPDWTVLPIDEAGVHVRPCAGGPGCSGASVDPALTSALADAGMRTVGAAPERVDAALVVTPAAVADADLWGAFGGPTRVTVTRWSDPGSSAGTVFGWMVSGVCVAAGLFALMVLREAGDRTLMAAIHDRPVQRIGIGPRRLAAIRWGGLAVPMLLACPVAIVSAVAFSYFGLHAGITVFAGGRILLVGFVCAVASLAVMTASLALAARIERRIPMCAR